MGFTREQVDALINTMTLQQQSLENQLADLNTQLVATNGAVQVLQHLLSLEPNEEDETHGD